MKGEPPVVAIITDYGLKDTYVAQVKGVILSYRRDAVIIDVTHEVEPFNELEAAFLMTTYVPYMPPGTIHICVVDPKVGGERKPVFITTARGDIFIGPDTGFMAPSAEMLGVLKVYEIDELKLPKRFSETFHGRDIFAHVAGRLISGAGPDELGRPAAGYRRIEIPRPEVEGDTIKSTVLHVDRFGNIITNVRFDQLHIPLGHPIEVSTGRETVRCVLQRSYSYVERGGLLATIGGTGYLEISVNMGNASERLGVKPGDRLEIRVAKNI